MLTDKKVQKLAKELKIDTFTVRREYLQLLFLKYFYAENNTDQVFFKGGTALRLLYDSFRFSEDLDFTSVLGKEKLRKTIEKSLKKLQKEVSDLSFKEQESIADSYTGKIYQQLEELDFPLTVRLDFSMREEPYRTDSSLIETQFPVSPYPQVSHLTIEEILAEKVRAVTVRVRGRDIFDLWFILSKKVDIDWKLVEKKMDLYEDRTATPETLIERINGISQKKIKNDLAKFLPASHRNLTEEIKDMALEKLEAEK